MIKILKNGCGELLSRRMLLAFISSVTLQFFFICCFVLLINTSTDYVRWFRATWTIVASSHMWAYLVVLVVVTFLQGFLCCNIYLHTPPYYKSRFTRLCSSLAARNLLLRAFYIFIGGVMVWLHLSLVGEKHSSSAATNCDRVKYEICLAEERYFLLLGGLWSGLYFFAKIDGSVVGKYPQFPIIAQSKFFRLKRRICAMLPTLIASSTWSALYYATGYYFLGSCCRTVLLSAITMRTEVESLGAVSRLLNLTLMSQLWLHQFIFVLTISCAYLLFEIYLTEWVHFKFDARGAYSSNKSELSLTDALSMVEVPIMQHLGYLDLVVLAQKDQTRRRLLFTLSQPGGHPYNWNCIVQKCIDLLRKFSSDLNAVSVKPPDQTFCYSTKLSTTVTQSVPFIAQKDYTYHMRRLIPPPLATETTDMWKEDTAVTATAATTVCSGGWSIQKSIKQKRDVFIAYLFSKPLINYIFGEQDDNKIRYILFSNGQPVIWAAEAISSLSVFSLNEDSYGIVQKDVPTIIDVLLSVKQALDKLQKSAILIRKIQTDDNKLIREIFTSLRSAVKRSLYRIVTNFEPYINDLFLESVKIEQLRSFLNYKE